MYSRRRWIGLSVSGITFVTVAYLMITGSPVLEMPIRKGSNLPWGTFLTWFGLMSLPAFLLLSHSQLLHSTQRVYVWCARFLRLAMWLAVFWVPISFLLSGNMGFNFSEKESFQGGQTAMKLFWGITYSLVLIPIFTWIIFWITLVLSKIR